MKETENESERQTKKENERESVYVQEKIKRKR